uniref:Uncharacterized protein n=1 Tax=Amphora coffeiformis TaxID=265554 RepID=A0A7S3L5A4_9STRA
MVVDYRQAYFKRGAGTSKSTSSPSSTADTSNPLRVSLQRTGSALRILERCGSLCRLTSGRNLLGRSSKSVNGAVTDDLNDSFSSTQWNEESFNMLSSSASSSNNLTDALKLQEKIQNQIEHSQKQRDTYQVQVDRNIELALARLENGGGTATRSALVSMRRVHHLRAYLNHFVATESQLVALYRQIEEMLGHDDNNDNHTDMLDLEHVSNEVRRIEEMANIRPAVTERTDFELSRELRQLNDGRRAM